jgi:D-alanyl-lipoteichoic acid acyltransferase DltB (MBOAT superfamily)
MPILSIEFTLFFLIFFPIYWACYRNPKLQNVLLLISGIGWLIYIQFTFALVVVIFSLLIGLVSFQLYKAKNQQGKKLWLWIGIIVTILNLMVFKYYDFFRPALQFLFKDSVIDILMPLGISYYSFQAISYLVSIYRGEEVKLRWYELMFYFSNFTTITAGPILRANSMKSIYGISEGATVQIQTQTRRYIIRPALAISLILLGIIKKWWLAGIFAANWVNPVFENPMQYSSLNVLGAIYGYTIQLFFDFSGYTDLVIGIAMLLGFKLPQNFCMPLKAFNIRDFWDRWHISLSTWIRDYIYIPLGGSKKGFIRTQINLLLAMIMSGVWHGYGWNFFIWGLLHGVALVLLNIGDKIFGGREKLSSLKFGKVISIFITFNFVCFTFVIFRTNSISDAVLMFQALAHNHTKFIPDLSVIDLLLATSLVLIYYELIVKLFTGFVSFLERISIWLWFIPILAILMIVIVLAPSGIPGFIYANF